MTEGDTPTGEDVRKDAVYRGMVSRADVLQLLHGADLSGALGGRYRQDGWFVDAVAAASSLAGLWQNLPSA